MKSRILMVAAALAASFGAACAEPGTEPVLTPALRPSITVAGDVVRIGDFVDNAGSAANIAIFRAPDPGTTGSVPASQILSALRAHHVIGVDTRDIAEVVVTRASRTVPIKEIEERVAQSLARQNGLGDAKDLAINFDRDLRALQLDPANRNELRQVYASYNPRTSRFDVAYEIARDTGGSPLRLRFTGTVIETVEAALVTRAVERGEILKASDVVTQRIAKTEAGPDPASRERAVGMAIKRSLRVNQPLRAADLAKPDLVTRDQNVTITYEIPGIFLTARGKALESGAEGDLVNVVNPQSKRTIQGVVTGPAQITVNSIAPASPRIAAAAPLAPENTAAPSRQAE
jgi:flagella basal body P-ring formation protein FlgA